MKAIFWRELRAGLFPDAMILLLALGTFTFAERVMVVAGEQDGETRQVIDLVLLGCAALMSFASGARTFPGEAKARRVLYLYTLPISRGALWCALVGGRFTATVIALAGLFLARPSIPRMLGQTDPALGSTALWLLTLVPVLFGAGVCCSLTFENAFAVYLIGYPVAIFTVIQALGPASAGSPSWQPVGFAIWLWILALFSIVSLFLGFSWWFFRRADLSVRRWTLAKQVLLAVSLLSMLLIITTATRALFLSDRAGPWTQLFSGYEARLASPGGRYLAIAERLTRHPRLARLSIGETATGRVVTKRIFRDLRWASWSGQAQVLHLLVLDHWAPEPWRSLAVPQPTLIRLSPEGRELSRFRLEGDGDIAPLRDGSDLVLHGTDGKTQFLRLEGRGSPSALVEVPAVRRHLLVRVHGQGAVVIRHLGQQKTEIWHVESRIARKINSPRSFVPRSFVPNLLALLNDEAVPQPLVQSTMAKMFGRPGQPETAAAVSGFFLEPMILESGPPAPVAFFLEQNGPSLSLWTRSLKSPGWERRATGLAPADAPGVGWPPSKLNLVREDQRPALFLPASLAVYLPTGGLDGRAALYDGTLDREIPLPACERGRAAFPELIPADSSPAFLVRYQCRTGVGGGAARLRHFLYCSGAGQVKPLPLFDRFMANRPVHRTVLEEATGFLVDSTVRLAYLDETTAIWRSEDGTTWTALRDGRVRTLWPPRP